MQRRGGKVLMVDDSFKISKHIQKVGDAKLIDGLHTGMNEYGEIRLLHFIQSTAFSEKEQSLKNYYSTATAYKILPEVLFVDNCCSVRSSYEKALPSLCKNLKTWKLLPLPENVLYSKPRSLPDEINTMLQPIVDYLTSLPDEKTLPIGLDTEWPVNYGAGVEQKIAVIQIALYHPVQEKNYVYVFSVANFDQLPENLMFLLQSPKVIKYGNRIISADHRKLLSDWDCDIRPEKCEKLNWLCNQKGVCQNKMTSLKTMTQMCLGYTLDKDADIRKCDWKKPLTKEQQSYAARDALASFLIGILFISIIMSHF